MNLQQVGQSRSSNGYGRRKSEREGAAKSENKISSGKSNANRLASTGELLTLITFYFPIVNFANISSYRYGDWQYR